MNSLINIIKINIKNIKININDCSCHRRFFSRSKLSKNTFVLCLSDALCSVPAT